MRAVGSEGPAIVSVFLQPPLVALLACALCALGLIFLVEDPAKQRKLFRDRESPNSTLGKVSNLHRKNLLYTILTASSVALLVLLWTKSVFITMPFVAFSSVISWQYFRRKGLRQSEALLLVWPEVIDHLISGVQSGLSLTEALVGLGSRGPEILRPHFLLFQQELSKSGDFTAAAEALKRRCNSHGSDQILEAILLAKSLGGSELMQIFRTLGDFLRQDLALRKEIEIKHGWIKNSAHLSSAAPWLLLLLLSTQPGTVSAFSEPTGVLILFLGVLLTSVAYLWMGRLGRLPASPRVFGSAAR